MDIDGNELLSSIDHMIIGGFYGILFAAIAMVVWRQLSIWRGAGKMQKKQEDARVKRVFSDILVDGVVQSRLLEETDVNYLSPAVANDWLKKFGNILSISDLIPRNETMMKDRLSAKHLADPSVTETKPVSEVAETPLAVIKRDILGILRPVKTT